MQQVTAIDVAAIAKGQADYVHLPDRISVVSGSMLRIPSICVRESKEESVGAGCVQVEASQSEGEQGRECGCGLCTG